MGLPTLRASPSRPHMLLMTPKYTQVAPCVEGKKSLKGYPSKDKRDLKGGLIIRDLWAQGTDSIHNMRVMNSETTS